MTTVCPFLIIIFMLLILLFLRLLYDLINALSDQLRHGYMHISRAFAQLFQRL